jgi:peptide/nickel transport system substrate-binding protein
LAFLVAGLALVAASCGGDDDSSDATEATTAAGVTEAPGATTADGTAATDGTAASGATTPDASTPAGTADGTTPASAAECADDSLMRYGAANIPSRLDPHRSSNGYDQNYLAPVFDRLIHQTPEVELEPSLATEWAFTDDLTFEMTLRDDVTFTDGTPFDADAVVANIERAKTVEGSGVAAYLARVDTVTAVDPTHVTFTLSTPDATLPNQLATRPGMMMSPAAMENTDLDTKPVGSGPYTLVEYRDSEVAIYERNPDYWNPDFVGPARLEIYYFPDNNTRLNALRTGQVDAAPVGVEQIDEVKGMDDLNIDIYDSIETYHFQPDRTKSEFGDPLVRQALSHAIDREAIVQGLMFGYATPATQWVAEGTPSYVDDLGDSTTYDVDRAKELLAEAGLPDGFTFNAMTSVQPTYVRLAEILQGEFAEIGVTMNVTQDPQLADAFFVRNATDAIVTPFPGRVDPSETAQVYFNDESFSNPGREIAPEVKEAWLASLIPGDGRPEALKELVTAIDVAMPNIPILYPQVGLAYTDQVDGLTWYKSGHIEFAGVCVTSD